MRKLVLCWVFGVVLGAVGCDDSTAGSYVYTTSSSSGGSGGEGPSDLGVGKACLSGGECRHGLACLDGHCAPGHSLGEGEACVISGECQHGLYCADGQCAPAGDGTDGSACASDADCASGLRCALDGLGARCVAEGSVDLGGACSTSEECFGGLACLDGACAQPPGGTPPFGPQWPGVDCPDESGPVQAYFRVPRGLDDGDFYRLPMPNDVRFTDGKIDLSGHPTPGSALLGYDLVDRYLRAVEQSNDGWGLYQVAFFRFSGVLDTGTLASHLKLVNLTQDYETGYFYRYGSARTAYMCGNRLSIGPLPGATFRQGETYAALLTTEIKAEDGSDIVRSDDLAALLGDTLPADASLAAAWPKYAGFRAYLAAHAIDPATILNATVFTVGHPRDLAERLDVAIQAALAPAVTGWTRCDQGVVSPCPDATDTRACAAADADFDELHALVALPIFQQGTAPYLTPADGGDVGVDAGGNPLVDHTEQVCLSLTVPKGTPPPGGWPTVVFAHGTGGNFRSHVLLGLAHDFALGVDDGTGNMVRAAVLGIDQVGHGPRRGGSVLDPYQVVYNYANPLSARGTLQQAAADQMSLLRLVPTVAFDAASSPTPSAFSLAASPALWGHSQGATAASIALPYRAWSGAVLSGQGASVRDSLATRLSPVDIAHVLPWVLSDRGADGLVRGGAEHPVLGWMQALLEGADPVAFGRLAVRVPPAGSSAHHLLQLYGLGDSDTPSGVQASYAAAAGLELAAPDPSVGTPEDIGYPPLVPVPVPVSGNVTVLGKTVTAVVREYAPDAAQDGHLVAFDLASARADAERFLAGALGGGMPRVGQ